MAFQSAAGYNNLPNGNFSAVIYSQKVQLAFRKKTVVEAITNSDYFGEIASHGDTVRVIKEPEIQVNAYARGATVTPQDLDDEDFTLTIDKANHFAFKVDDIEEAHSHVNFESLASNRAGYKMADQMDQEILGYMAGHKQSTLGTVADTVNDQVNGTKAIASAGSDELLTSMKLKKGDFGSITTGSAGDHSIPIAPSMPGATSRPTAVVSAYDVVSRMKTLLDKQFNGDEDRWIVLDPDFLEVLRHEDSRFLNADWGDNGALYSGDAPARIAGFTVYKSNNLPSVGTGANTSGTANQNTDYGVIVAGCKAAVATASQINKVESFRSETTFADVVRGMNLYGRKILKPESIVTAKYNIA